MKCATREAPPRKPHLDKTSRIDGPLVRGAPLRGGLESGRGRDGIDRGSAVGDGGVGCDEKAPPTGSTEAASALDRARRSDVCREFGDMASMAGDTMPTTPGSALEGEMTLHRIEQICEDL